MEHLTPFVTFTHALALGMGLGVAWTATVILHALISYLSNRGEGTEPAD